MSNSSEVTFIVNFLEPESNLGFLEFLPDIYRNPFKILTHTVLPYTCFSVVEAIFVKNKHSLSTTLLMPSTCPRGVQFNIYNEIFEKLAV